jgi:lipopolysaccharide/colanic/teichoic acid biosynthesis glycosyltransferase
VIKKSESEIGLTSPGAKGDPSGVPDADIVHRWSYRFMKRGIDIGISFAGLLFLAPLLTVVAILIKLTSKGPVFFRWRVIGRGGKRFDGFKFRTMVPDAEKMKERLLLQNEMRGPVFKILNDPRITPLGRILRKYSIDEIPQLWSVLKGDMSLVGPRPPLASEWVNYEAWHRRRLSVVPGITCLWQVNGRNAVKDFNQWVNLDLYYIDHWSPFLDLRILIKTVSVVLRGTGR